MAASIISAGVILAPLTTRANEVEIVDASARNTQSGWTISVTLRHADTGWDHYADLWQVYTPAGELLGERVLLHPHENEQPLTRSLSGIHVPETIDTVIIRARDSVHGVSEQVFELKLPAPSDQ
ncbi:hypothetical protein FMN50_13960 [Rhodobacterales bacterium]|nr:hypothetical protein FMN50_13960 [Rhodobacterales bacterium]